MVCNKHCGVRPHETRDMSVLIARYEKAYFFLRRQLLVDLSIVEEVVVSDNISAVGDSAKGVRRIIATRVA